MPLSQGRWSKHSVLNICDRLNWIAFHRDGISIDQFVSSAIADEIAALMTEGYLKKRSKRESRAKYEAILTKVPDVEPEVYDR